jgi:hypothetical protein
MTACSYGTDLISEHFHDVETWYPSHIFYRLDANKTLNENYERVKQIVGLQQTIIS